MQRGKVQERMVVFPSGDLSLEGLYHRGKEPPSIVVASPHPRFGGSMDSPVVSEVAFGAAREKHPALRFNYRGVGASQGPRAAASIAPIGDKVDVAASADAAELADFRAAMAELRATSSVEPVIAAGYSFGAAVALAIARTDPGIEGAILVAPPNRAFDFSRLGELRVPSLIVGGTEDDWIDWAEIDAFAAATPAITVVRIELANHVFDRGLVALGRAVAAFVEKLAP